ncbi:MAG: serine hydrolase domain-containing protein, partial [Candidatus Binataceae bacterium]
DLNPLARYTPERIYASLPRYGLMYRPGSHYQYANLGFGLLGLALANRAGKDYEALVVERICGPLNLQSTRITLTPEMRVRVAPGHDFQGSPAPLWDLPGLAGAGAVRSTAHDLGVLLEACLGLRRTPLQASIAKLTEIRRPTGESGTVVGLGWFISTDRGKEMVFKTGLTGGHRSNIAYLPATRRGVLILSNTQQYDGLELSVKTLDPDFQLKGIERLF